MKGEHRNLLTSDEIDEIREAFLLFDVNGTGKLNLSDLRAVMERLNFQNRSPTVYNIITSLERKYNDPVDFNMFLDAIISSLGDRNSKEGIRKIFSLFDVDKTGTISVADLKRVTTELGESLSDAELKEIVDRADSNGYGEITFDDFYAIMTKRSC